MLLGIQDSRIKVVSFLSTLWHETKKADREFLCKLGEQKKGGQLCWKFKLDFQSRPGTQQSNVIIIIKKSLVAQQLSQLGQKLRPEGALHEHKEG